MCQRQPLTHIGVKLGLLVIEAESPRSQLAGEPQGPERPDPCGVPGLRHQPRRLAGRERVPQHRGGTWRVQRNTRRSIVDISIILYNIL